ncbi:unnamed protein product, partial [Urochloa humidicola]
PRPSHPRQSRCRCLFLLLLPFLEPAPPPIPTSPMTRSHLACSLHTNLCAAVSTSTVQPGRGRPLQVHAPDPAPPRRCRESGRRGSRRHRPCFSRSRRATRASSPGTPAHRRPEIVSTEAARRRREPRASSRTGWLAAARSRGGEPVLLDPAAAHALLDPGLPRHLCSTRVPSVEGWVRRATELPPR